MAYTHPLEPEPLPAACIPTSYREPHPDHHLWRNGRVWWAAFTVHGPTGRSQRIRTSLRTTDPRLARRRRDDLLSRAARLPGWRLALRFAAREKADGYRNARGGLRSCCAPPGE